MSKQQFKLGWMSLVVVVGAGACRSEQMSDPPDTYADTPAPAFVGPARQVDLATHATLAFRATADGYAGGYTTQRATIRDGLVEVTPFAFLKGERQLGDPMRLETTAITLDGVSLGELTGTRLEDGAVILERGQIDERLRNEVDGLHQEWAFKAAPAGSGDLVFEISVFGHEYATTTDNGVHLASPSGAGFVYSHAVWAGSDGTAWPITAVHDNGRIRMTVPEGVLRDTVFPAVLDPTVSAESDVDAPVIGSIGANTATPALASDGTGYLVVWADQRNSVDSDIWGTRLDASGAIVDSLGIEIATAPGVQTNPTVAFNGSSYVVAWEDFKVKGGTVADIGVATVASTGSTVTVTALPAVAATSANEIEPALAGGGGTALLAWNAGGDIRGALYAAGTGSFGAPFDIAVTTAAEVSPAVAVDASGNYLVVWSEGPATTADLRGQLVTAAGALSGAVVTVSAGAGAQSLPAATFDGTNYAVVWINNSAVALSVMGTRVSTAGVVLDTHQEAAVTVGGVNITGVAQGLAVPAEASIGCLASGCFVLWTDRRNVEAAGSFDLFGQALQPDFTANGGEVPISTLAGKQLSPALGVLGPTGTSFVSAWTDNRDGATNTVFGSALSPTGTPSDTGHPLVSGTARETQPALGTSANTFGVFWGDSRTYGGDIQFVRYHNNGARLGTSVVAVSAPNSQLAPAASSDLGGSTLAVWVDTRLGAERDIFGARFSMVTGAGLDGSGFAISTAASDQVAPSVASNGTVALVTWADRRSGTTFDIRGALVTSAGTLVAGATDIAICTDAVGDQESPAVTWDNVSSQFIVLWSDNRSGVFHIFGARVSASGAVLDPANGIQVSNGAVGQFAPAVASNGVGSFAVWDERKQGRDIFGTRLSAGGTLNVRDPDGLAISTAAESQSAPQIASMVSSYAVVWVDSRNTQTDIMGQQLTANGAVSGPEFVVSNGPTDELSPTIMTAAGNGRARVAYESRRLNTTRVETRLITSVGLTGGVCTTAAQCESGFCVDNRCCDTACGGDDPTDCQACSNKLTGQADGVCSPRPAAVICRSYASVFCDVSEQCDGVSAACPADVPRSANSGATCDRATNDPPGTGTGVCKAAGLPGPYACF